MENYFSSLDYVPTLEDQEAIANGLYQKKTGLWDETQDGPAEIYYNPPVDWWKVPVTSSRTMSFGCSENQITANIPCARYFDFSKEVFEKMGSIKSYNHLARIIIRASALESGPWFEYSQGERLRRAHGGGHSLERTVCAVHGELFETWLQNTLPCAGTKAGMETNINYNPLETDPSSDEDDIVYDDSGNPTPTRPAWKDLYDASGPDYKKDWTGEPVGYAYYKTLVNKCLR